MKIAIAQITSSNDVAQNLRMVLDLMEQAAGADVFMTPEVTNCISDNPAHLVAALGSTDQGDFLDAVCAKAKELKISVLLGSLAVCIDDKAPKFANRSYFIDDWGVIRATYDKIHMFDVRLSDDEIYQESRHYVAGDCAALCQTPMGRFGLSICYDLRFAHLYRTLAQHGAQVICVPAAFAVPTGQAHWHVLLRARAIETGCFIVAPAQVGAHAGSNRQTFGHSLIVNPWGEVVLDAGEKTGLFTANINLEEVASARARVPSLTHDRAFELQGGTPHG